MVSNFSTFCDRLHDPAPLVIPGQPIQGEGAGCPDPPPPPHQTWPLFETEILTATESYITFSLADFFLKKRTLHFAASLNSRDIQECNWFGVPSYDLFALLAKQYFPRQRRPTFTDWETRGRLFEKWFATKKFNSPFRTKVWIPQGKTPGSAPELGSVEAFNWKWEKVLTFNCYNARKALEYVIVKRACFRSLSGHAPFNEEICLKR